MEVARSVYRRYGFVPIDTPTLEYLEILTGKGSEETDRQMYHFTDAGGREVGMRFDLTVPFARFAAQHINELGTPFKRYHIAPVGVVKLRKLADIANSSNATLTRLAPRELFRISRRLWLFTS